MIWNVRTKPSRSTCASAEHCSRVADAAHAIDRALGRWLLQKGPSLAQRVRARQLAGEEASIPALWRSLVWIWCLSPSARREYPGEERKGLLIALAAMDDEMASSLIQGLLDEAGC